MSTRNLEHLFHPNSIAVIGATSRPESVGSTVLRNLLRSDFAGPVIPVNPKYQAVEGVLCYPSVTELPIVPDLAVIATPARVIPSLITELGERGTRAAVILTANLKLEEDESGRTLEQAMLDAARPYLLRLLGPNSLGLLIPRLGLNASFAHMGALPGKVALIHQSGMLCTALLDWAHANKVGFSHFISLGDIADIDFGDVLDYLGSEPTTKAILLHIESLKEARKFMSAARAAARNKPVLVIKTGRVLESARLIGAEALSDDQIFAAAIRRAGMLRVFNTDEMFDAVETLAHTALVRGDRLAIITNGMGPAVLATDDLIIGGGKLATLTAETTAKLADVLPPARLYNNPVDLLGNGAGTLYGKALEIVLKDPQVDAVLVLHAPHPCVSSEKAAEAVIEAAQGARKTVLTSWLGGNSADKSRQLFAAAGVSTYTTPEKAVRAFLHLARYRHNQELLMETPPSLPTAFSPNVAQARAVIDRALQEDRLVLNQQETQEVLTAYGLPVVKTRIGRDADEAVEAAKEVGFPVAVKLLSPDIHYESEVGGVVLYLESPEAVREAVAAIQHRLSVLRPAARLAGFAIQEMVYQSNPQELLVHVKSDPVFGPVIVFGERGTTAQADQAVALPPLNVKLARELLSQTRIAQLSETSIHRDNSRIDIKAIELALLQISQLIIDLPELVDLQIDPLLADYQGVLAQAVQIRLQPTAAVKADRLAIRPYPRELEEQTTLNTGRQVLLRPIRPEDEDRFYAFRRRLTSEDLYYRFFLPTRWDIPHAEMARLTQIDYDREMAFIATAPNVQGNEETLGVVRTVTDPNNMIAEFAIIIRSDLKRQGLGQALLEKMIEYCRNRGTGEMIGHVIPSNHEMQDLAKRFGFERHFDPDLEVVEVRLRLQP